MANPAKQPIPFSKLSFAHDPSEPPDLVGARILDAAFEQFCLIGIRRSSMEDVARRAKVGRVTIYRRFESKDKLVSALLWRETRTAIAAVEEAVRDVADVEERFVRGFVAGMSAVRRHPLLVAMLSTEPETALPLLTTKAQTGFEFARAFLAREIRRARKDLDLPDSDAEQVAEIFARLTHSLVLTPGTCWPLDDDAKAREFARRHIVPLVTLRIPARGATRRKEHR
jgi:AcrR family transcriptional regulator